MRTLLEKRDTGNKSGKKKKNKITFQVFFLNSVSSYLYVLDHLAYTSFKKKNNKTKT